jgi:hypothetical protein
MPQPNAAKVEKREIPALSLRASVVPSSVNAEARTVDVVWTTGARVLRGWYDPFYEELSLDPTHVRLDRINNGAPFLDSHESWSLRTVIGVVEAGTAKLNGQQGTATVRFAKAEDDPDADKIFRKVIDGIIQNISVGYRVWRYAPDKLEEGSRIPVRTAIDWEPFEISAVPMGADDGAGFRSVEKVVKNICEFETRQQESDPMPDPVVTPPVADDAARAAATAAASTAAADAERTRITSIRLAVRAAQKAGLTEVRATEIEDAAVSNKTPIHDVRALLLEDLAKRDDSSAQSSPNRIEMGEDVRDKFVRGASAWLFMRAGITDVLQRAQKIAPNNAAFRDIATDPGEFRGLSMRDIARECLERAGVKTRGLSPLDLVGRALTYRAGGGMNSTSDFAVLLENVMHKTTLSSYMITPDTWSRFCGTKTVTDFRDHNHYRLGSFGSLDSLNEHGEFKNKSIPDAERVKTSVTTKGNIISLSRQAIINDDMGAIMETAQGFGRSSKLTVEVAVYSLLAQNAGLGPTQADGQPFFHAANRKNVSTSAAITVNAIDADRVVMGKQKDPSNNEYLDLRPAILLVPLEIGGTARVINANEYDTKDNSFQTANKVRGLFRDVVDSARMSDISATRRYLFADPNVWPAIVVSWLEGQTEPFLDSQDCWRVDGVEWKLRLDFGVKEFDARAAVTNAGN